MGNAGRAQPYECPKKTEPTETALLFYRGLSYRICYLSGTLDKNDMDLTYRQDKYKIFCNFG